MQAWFAAGMARCWHLLPLAGRLWAAAYCGAMLAQGIWRRKHPASYLRFRKYSVAMLRVFGLGCGLGPPVMAKLLLEQTAGLPRGCGGLATVVPSLLRLVFSSGAPTMALFAFAWQMGLRCAAPPVPEALKGTKGLHELGSEYGVAACRGAAVPCACAVLCRAACCPCFSCAWPDTTEPHLRC